MKKVSAIHSKRARTPAPSLNATQNDLASDTRAATIKQLQCRLADAIDLMLQAKQAHWNVKGPQFAGLHALFDTVHEEVSGYMDLLAERSVALGAQIVGTARFSAEHSSLKEYPHHIQAGLEHAKALSRAIAHFAHLIRQDIDAADELGDKVTSDILTEIARGLDTRLWMVEAHAQ